MERLPHVQFTNLYGPTETTIASSYHTIAQCPQNETAPIPIGTACDGEELLVLNDGLERVPPGVAGNLFIGGVGLSPGYWNDPETTARAFLRSPFSSDPSDRIYRTGDLAKLGDDGLVYFLGRNDTQIKSRGYRIEIGEIEAALNAISGLQESAVVAIGGPDTTIICCAYVPARGTDLSPAALRKLLSDSLPHYMLPMRWRSYSALHKNSSGKIDRRMLKDEFIGGEAATESQPAEGPAKAVA
jgi:acyl-coenzyme A synthetase/AMP-(fatty) acid ligase